MQMKIVLMSFLIACVVGSAQAEVRMDPVEYKQGDTVLRGYVAYDTDVEGKRPGVLVVHEWWGLNDYAKSRAKQLAEKGYVAFALDMYGEGKTTNHPQEAGEWSGAIGSNKEMGRERFLAARSLLAKNERTDPEKIAAIGYCFGGAVVQIMALNGVDLDAVVSFHGGFPDDPIPGEVKASILVCHGADDAMATAEQMQAFQKKLTEAGVDWELNVYGGAKHSFTNPGADDRGLDVLGYNAEADRRSWSAMLAFLEEAFE